ncbi:MAG TPA: ATP-binding protein [Thermoanaerobaculia bacterium]|jgi:two-component system nitrogen regulation sensor histidine kinase NtrY|nr:ATP-binding protein [Thermoanaerobaculia bacterium]
MNSLSLRERLFRHRKDNRLIFAVLAGALLFFTLVYYLILRGQETPSGFLTNSLLLFVLRYINVVLILAVLFVLLRDLLKLWVERQHRALGSKFKTKLVATYIALSLLPVLLLFAYASELIQGSVERIFRTPVRQVLEQGNAVSQELTSRIAAWNQRGADRVLAEIADLDIGDPRQRPHLGEILTRRLREEDLDLLLVYQETQFVHAVLDPNAGPVQLPEPGSSFLLSAIREGRAVRVIAPPGQDQHFILSASAVQEGDAKPEVVVAGTVLDADIAGKTDSLVTAYQDYRKLEVQKPDIKASYVLLILMVTLVLLLTSSWVGLYLARRVTVPIEALAEGTRRVAEGDLDHRVDVAADDELGVLVESFNRMTGELRDNHLLLEAKNEELVQINQRLDDERSLISTVLKNVAAGVISVDQEGRVFTCNDAALAMLHQSESELLGRPLEEAWGDAERGKLRELHRRARGRIRREVQLRLGGEWKTLEVGITPLQDPAGVATGHVIVLEDLTELIQAQKLATWNEAARRVAHEIKNPLTPIRLSAERLLKKYREGDPGLGTALEDGVKTIVREVASMKQMVDEFSRFARMPRPQPTEVDLEELMRETLQLYRDVKPGVELAWTVTSEARRARFDKEQLRGVLINLLDNAVEATTVPGSVDVRAFGNNGSVVLQVRDSGPGISDEAKEKLFLPYYSTKGRGSGLGLAIVHRVVTDHGGTIRVEDNRPNGTVFTIELPQG